MFRHVIVVALTIVTVLLLLLGQPVSLAQDDPAAEETAAPVEATVTEPLTESPATAEPLESTPTPTESMTPEITAEATDTAAEPETSMPTDAATPESTEAAAAVTETPTAPPLTPTDEAAEVEPTPAPASWFSLYDDDFAAALEPRWQSEGWTQDEPGSLRASGDPAVLRFAQPLDLLDQAVTVRAQVGAGLLELRLRDSVVNTWYALRWQGDTLTLLRVDTPVAMTAASAADGWRALRLAALDNTVTVTLDDAAVLSFTDDSPLPPGGFSIYASGGVLLDSFALAATQRVALPAVTVETAEPDATAAVSVMPEATASVTDAVVVVVPTFIFADDPLDALGVGTEEAQAAESEPRLNTAPQLVAPLASINTQRPSFRWNKVDGADLYHLQVSTSATFSSNILIDATSTKTSYTPATTQLLPEGDYYWRARTQDGGVWGGFSAAQPFRVHLLNRPLEDEYTTDTTPAFSWIKVTGAVAYQLEVSLNSDFTALLDSFPVVTTRTSYTLPNTVPIQYGHYYWRVSVDTGGGLIVSPFYRRVTITPRPPAAPVLTSPLSRALTNQTTPTLTWNPVGDAESYRVQISADSRFGSTLYNEEVTDPEFTVPAVLGDGKYYWRVAGLNYLGAPSAWSRAFDFTIDTIPPGMPLLTSPLSGFITEDDTPLLRWNTVPTATSYEIRLNPGATPLVSFATARSASFTPTAPLLHTVYAWQVRAFDAAGNPSTWSEVRALTIQSSTRAAPVLNLHSSRTVTLTWTPVSWATAYEIQVANNRSFPTAQIVYAQVFTPEVLSATVENLPEGVYYWRVRARTQTVTRWGGWSAPGMFAIEE